MADYSEKIAQADHYYAIGRYDAAERLLYEVVGKQRRHWGVWHRLAATSLKLGKNEHAERSARKAIEINSQSGSLHSRLGVVLRASGKLDEAIDAYKRGLSYSADDAGAWFNLGNAFRAKGETDHASRCYQKAIALRPDFVQAHHNLALVLAAAGAPNAALQYYEQALQLAPDSDRIWVDKGNLLRQLRRNSEAMVCYETALEKNPKSIAALSNLGNELRAERRFEESLDVFERAMAIAPEEPVVLNNRGITLHKLNRFGEAEASYRKALELKPDYANAFYNWGDLYTEQSQFEVGKEHYEQAIEKDPSHPEAHFHLAHYYLRQGDFERGWPLYEWRWKTREALGSQREFDFPMWDGSDLDGKTIFVHAEQGAGDTLQFIRYAKLLKNRGATVVCECPARLMAVLTPAEGVDRWIATGKDTPECDFHAPLLSLPWLLETTADSIPNESPYLSADPALRKKWRSELSEIDGFKVGIAWQGSVTYHRDRTRSFSLQNFAPLAEIPDVRLIALQKGEGAQQAAVAPFPLANLASRLDTGSDGFVDTAAVMAEIDLVITSDTSIAHLAGSLGVPVWVALNDVPEWRWQLGREDSPWYPSMRLFRQRQRGDWDELFERVAAELKEQVATAR